jgi:hypothetical protein
MVFLTDFFNGFVLRILSFNPAGGAVAVPLVVDKVAWRASYTADCAGSESVES